MRRITGWALCASLSMLGTCLATGAYAAQPVAAPELSAARILAAPELTAAQIIERNSAARGGLEAWRKIQTMVWVGHVERGTAPGPKIPFVLEQKRPNKTRFEITAENKKSVHVFDGTNGWKIRPSSSGKPELQPYTAEELTFARDAQVIDGPLIDYTAKGVAVTLGGVEEIEGHKAYRMNVRLPSGLRQVVWIDAQSFLDLKLDRAARGPKGQASIVSVFYRNYQSFEGLQIPLTIETGAAGATAADKLVIDKLALNAPLDDQMFAKPRVPGARRNAVTVDTRSVSPVPPTLRPTPNQ